MGAVENPAHAGLAVGAHDGVEGICGRRGHAVVAAIGAAEGNIADAVGERTLGTQGAVAGAAPETGPFDIERAKGVLTGEIQMTEALVAIDECGTDVD